MKIEDELLRTCRHEAAHAVITEHYGVRVKRIVILPTDEGGLVEYDARFRGGRVIRTISALAGTSAEQLWHGLGPFKVSCCDAELIEEIIEPGRRDWTVLLELSRLLVAQHRSPIFRVARVLVKAHTANGGRGRVMSGSQLRALLA